MWSKIILGGGKKPCLFDDTNLTSVWLKHLPTLVYPPPPFLANISCSSPQFGPTPPCFSDHTIQMRMYVHSFNHIFRLTLHSVILFCIHTNIHASQTISNTISTTAISIFNPLVGMQAPLR